MRKPEPTHHRPITAPIAATMDATNSTIEFSFVERAINFYAYTLTLADSRTKGWLFVDSPVPTITLTSLYLLAVHIGPMIMANKKPFQLRWALIAYSLAMSMVNLYIAKELFFASRRLNYSYKCESSREVFTPDAMRIANAVWWFYFSKCLEFTDSLFFVLRKKDNQLTFLHVYHHSTMFPLWWIGVKWVPSGSTFLPAMINSFVHIIMYMYYALAAMGPRVAKYLWWKRYLTIIQLIQFTIAMTASAVALYNECDFPLWMHWLLIVYMVTFLVLFGNFYIKSYLEKGRQAKINKRQSVEMRNAYVVDANAVGRSKLNLAEERDFILGHEERKKVV